MAGRGSLEEVLESVFSKARLFGVLYHSAAGRAEGRWAAYCALVWLHYLLIAPYLWRYLVWKHSGSPMRLFLWTIYTGLAHLCYPANVLCVLLQRRHLRLLLRHLRTADRLLTAAGRPPTYPSSRGVLLLELAVTTVTFTYFFKPPIWTVSTAAMFQIFWMQLVHMQVRSDTFFSLARLTAAQMARLTDLLQDSGPDRLLLLCRAHSTICSSATALDKLFSLQNLIIIGVIFYSIVCNTEHVFVAYHFGDLKLALNKIFYVCWFIVIAYKIIEIPTQINEKAEEFTATLYRLMTGDPTGALLANKKLRLHIQMKRDIFFTAGGFFNLDYPLIYNMLTGTASYLVILVEFGEHNLPTTPISPIANLSLHSVETS